MRIGVFFVLIFAFTACQTEEKQIQREITAIEQQSFQNLMDIDKNRVQRLLLKTGNYVQKHPDDTISARFLYQTSAIAKAIGNYEIALQHCEQLKNQYPKYCQTPNALLMAGLTAEEDMNNKARAVAYYQYLLKNYPNHPDAAHAQELLLIVDKPLEEIIEAFEQKNQMVSPPKNAKLTKSF